MILVLPLFRFELSPLLLQFDFSGVNCLFNGFINTDFFCMLLSFLSYFKQPLIGCSSFGCWIDTDAGFAGRYLRSLLPARSCNPSICPDWLLNPNHKIRFSHIGINIGLDFSHFPAKMFFSILHGCLKRIKTAIDHHSRSVYAGE